MVQSRLCSLLSFLFGSRTRSSVAKREMDPMRLVVFVVGSSFLETKLSPTTTGGSWVSCSHFPGSGATLQGCILAGD